ncbi:uncharacterized protein LY89DRAFT_766179 [Mollisia scopiformis]|uniref:2EXR domain-containing protein n=1 Tax=Mollisia scopiformis TaxID=149040 RepID=A0A132B6C0_MOLSC|nr:uncharacterized protein LY89DRAFT_766179 [Mollisia scopiformis]KUJ07549.1 hypothetical protein LY89DRAFT_766179 [Mollisia scopiformis]
MASKAKKVLKRMRKALSKAWRKLSRQSETEESPYIGPVAAVAPNAQAGTNYRRRVQPKPPTFHQFSRFPAELQKMIWEMAVPEPGILFMQSMPWTFQHCTFQHLLPETFADALPRPTAMLRVCSESSKAYKNAFPFEIPFAVCRRLGCDCGADRPHLRTTSSGHGILRFGIHDQLFVRNLGVLRGSLLDRCSLIQPTWATGVRNLMVSIDELVDDKVDALLSQHMPRFPSLDRVEAVDQVILRYQGLRLNRAGCQALVERTTTLRICLLKKNAVPAWIRDIFPWESVDDFITRIQRDYAGVKIDPEVERKLPTITYRDPFPGVPETGHYGITYVYRAGF